MAETPSKGGDRFYVQRDKHALFQRLSDKDEGPFEHLYHVFVFAAAYGFRYRRRVAIDGDRQHVSFWHYLSEARDVPLLQAIAVAETGSLEVLADNRTVIKIAEEYANGGIDLVDDLRRIDRDATLVSMATEVTAAIR